MTPYALYYMYNRRAEAILFPANQILVMNGVSIFGRARLRLLFIRFGREQSVGKLGLASLITWQPMLDFSRPQQVH